VKEGVNIVVVKELLGHKTIQMTMRYSHVASGAKQRAVSLLDSMESRSGHLLDTRGKIGGEVVRITSIK
jgi:hypothetical protein